MMVETHISLLEKILHPWKQTIGSDFDAYNNHVIRMLNFCFYLAKPNEEERQKLIIAAAFHDIGIWSHHTLDYLPPSVIQAKHYLTENGLEDWVEEIGLMIDEHHKITKVNDIRYPLIEIFRKADLVDFSLGLVKNGIPKEFVKKVRDSLPNAGFHKRLVQLSWQQIKKQPLTPFPMMKW